MAYVVSRRNGRFEIRESLHTPRGPRARSLASFDVLTGEVLARAAQRAQRPFDAAAVIASGRRAGARIAANPATPDGAYRQFVEASGRMARSMRPGATSGRRRNPGEALIELLGFADAVTRRQPARPWQPLTFPALSRLARERQSAASPPST
jgi:hypothetical protein